MPSWEVHRNLTKAAISKLGITLNKEIYNGLFEGIIDPDKVPDKVLWTYITKSGRVRISTSYTTHHEPFKNLINYYFNLSLYYLRKGDEFKAGFMLGRALHYIQDGALSKKRYFIFNIHNEEEKIMNEYAKNPQYIEILCKNININNKRKSSKAKEAICIAFKKSMDILNHFIEESKKSVNLYELKKTIRKIRIIKALIITIFTLPIIINPFFNILTFPIICIIIFFRPKIYYEAMKAGIIILKPISIEPAY